MVTPADTPVFLPKITGLQKIHEGKVRDLYAVDEEHMLIVTSDRLSAFDVILPDPIPQKGRVLTQLANFWFARTRHIVPNHLATDYPLDKLIEKATDDPAERERLRGRCIVVRRLKALPLEAVVRGYIIGSGWKDYQSTGAICGIQLPQGLKQADRLPEPIFTPASKAPKGQHDENISFEDIVQLVGRPLAEQVREVSLKLYNFAADHARARGIILADTKFEFGLDAAGTLTLIDEALTPDSSRFWPADTWQPGSSPPSFDKQIVRDYLETLDWDKKPPGPHLPAAVLLKTSEKYQEAVRRLTA